jgi:hypothetical protein
MVVDMAVKRDNYGDTKEERKGGGVSPYMIPPCRSGWAHGKEIPNPEQRAMIRPPSLR